MRTGMRPTGRVTASAAFYGLVVLAFVVLASLAASVAYSAPIYAACKSVWDNAWLWLSSSGVVLPLTLVASVVLLTGVTLVRHWRATRRLLTLLAVQQVPVTPRLGRIAAQVGLSGRVDCVAGVAVGPFCYGLRLPRVCVPVELLDVLDDDELRAMLRHEAHHAQSRDPLKIWLSRAVARGLYFVPVAADLRDSYLAAKEIAADETTTHLEELPLASALVKILSAGERWTTSTGLEALAPIADSETGGSRLSLAGLITVTREAPSTTEARIRRLVDGQPVQLVHAPSLLRLAVSGVILAVIFVASYTNLSAAAMMPVSPECAIESTLAQPTLSRSLPALGWSIGPADGLADAGAFHRPERQRLEGSRSCSLLTPGCSLVDDAGLVSIADRVTH